ncbi:acyl-CoA thioesterase [Oceanicola sp. 502str15]|uniref:acyl-CoA thioesterase n=1 Tax=Oceanicola sp. 502str15 TaxID=2696061 RepID=UPI002094EE7E|nr:acyl-CoA thioesterase [Oceanicola sp. 502str15]MCO6383855.1 thioeseterase [Oceanicola sp. 502str15]
MYPFIRMAKELWLAGRQPALPLDGTHISHHRCWPWDLDFWMELNNGRTLTLYDLGRIPLARRTGMIPVLRGNRWGLTIAGSVVRYRKRITMFQRFETRSRMIGWDHRFIYIEQSMWRGETCCGQAVFRGAVTGGAGIVPPAEVMAAMGVADHPAMTLPQWVTAWIAAEDSRPWPPERTG